MKTISSCPADSVQPPTDYGDYYCKPKSERWISAPVLKWTALLNGHPYHPCFSTALLFQLGKMIAARNHTMSDALSVLCSVHCLVIIRLPTKKSNSKKSSSKPQKRFFPYHRAYVHAILKVHILSEKLENMKSFVIFCLHSSHSARNSFHFHEFFWQNFVQKIWHEKLPKIN